MRYFVPAIAVLFISTSTALPNTTSVTDDLTDGSLNPYFNYDFDLDTPGIQSLSETGADHVNTDISFFRPDESLYMFSDALRITFNTTGDQVVESVQISLNNSPLIVDSAAFIHPHEGIAFEGEPNHPEIGNIRITATLAGGGETSTNLVIPNNGDFFSTPAPWIYPVCYSPASTSAIPPRTSLSRSMPSKSAASTSHSSISPPTSPPNPPP